jgi:hypothetical protein
MLTGRQRCRWIRAPVRIATRALLLAAISAASVWALVSLP